MNTTAKHLTFGGSTAHRWLRCAGSVQLCATLPPQVENEHMAAGTRAHALLELAATERRDSVLEFAGQSLRPGWPVFAADDVEAVQVALDYLNDLLTKNSDHYLYVERQVQLIEDVGGTADLVVYLPSAKALHVIDYKHGRGKYVEADNNPQLKLYAAATLFGFTEEDVTTICATIIQPRCQFGEPIRTAVYGAADLINYADEVEAAVAAARQPAPVFTPGETQCQWCPAAPVCPALQGDMKVPVVVANSYAEAAGAQDGTTLTIPNADAIRNNPHALAQVLEAANTIEAWLDAVKDHAEAYAKAGHAIPGFKLVDKRAVRKWGDEAGAQAWLDANTSLELDDYAPRKLLSVAQAETALKKAGAKDAAKHLAGFVTRESSGTKLVPSSAPGEAVPLAQIMAVAGGNAGDVVNS